MLTMACQIASTKHKLVASVKTSTGLKSKRWQKINSSELGFHSNTIVLNTTHNDKLIVQKEEINVEDQEFDPEDHYEFPLSDYENNPIDYEDYDSDDFTVFESPEVLDIDDPFLICSPDMCDCGRIVDGYCNCQDLIYSGED